MDDQQTFKIRSTIKPELLSLTLRKGGWIAAAGALMIVIAGTVLPVEQLKFWGIPIFLVGIALIAIGLMPYRQLSRLQVNPHELVDDGNHLFFLRRGKPLLKISHQSIEKMQYVEKDHLYGLAIWLKRPIEGKVAVLEKRFNIGAFASDSMQRFGCDLFLPYFSKGSIKDLLEQDHAS